MLFNLPELLPFKNLPIPLKIVVRLNNRADVTLLKLDCALWISFCPLSQLFDLMFFSRWSNTEIQLWFFVQQVRLLAQPGIVLTLTWRPWMSCIFVGCCATKIFLRDARGTKHAARSSVFYGRLRPSCACAWLLRKRSHNENARERVAEQIRASGTNECMSERGTHKQQHGAIVEFLFHHQSGCSLEAARILHLVFKMATKNRKVGDENGFQPCVGKSLWFSGDTRQTNVSHLPKNNCRAKRATLQRHHEQLRPDFKVVYAPDSALRERNCKHCSVSFKPSNAFSAVCLKVTTAQQTTSFKIPWNIAKANKPAVEGEFLKTGVADCASSLFSEEQGRHHPIGFKVASLWFNRD